ncbi:ly-6-related protein domain-containing protein [Ditylenchus destructor]|uniref:Ly-6-related protein domain-containing protein n=1 Tax=Ditylenchus destructor TaxID=166010 RepID=A0AAD4N6C1_9BILA|nr:ly-6-related protein domain-containing protein [Ditylenchus destructor]
MVLIPEHKEATAKPTQSPLSSSASVNPIFASHFYNWTVMIDESLEDFTSHRKTAMKSNEESTSTKNINNVLLPEVPQHLPAFLPKNSEPGFFNLDSKKTTQNAKHHVKQRQNSQTTGKTTFFSSPWNGEDSLEKREAELEDELRREFIRGNQATLERSALFHKKTYSTFPRQFECFSCMSASYENNWKHLQLMYTAPKVYTDQCNQPLLQRNMPTVLCGSMCITLLEPDVEAGVFLGYKYIRGCEDRILRHGFNHTALKTHRFMQMDKQCKNLPRASLFNQPRHVQLSVFGDVQFCTCFGDKCNGASAGSNRHLQFAPILLMCSIILTAGWSSFFTQFGITSATLQ